MDTLHHSVSSETGDVDDLIFADSDSQDSQR